MYQYTTDLEYVININNDQLIPFNSIEVQDWINSGNTLLPLTPIESPLQCTPRQFRQQLIVENLLTTIQTYIANIPDNNTRAIIENWWEYSSVFERNNPIVISVASELGLTEEHVTQIFKSARIL